MGWAMLYLFLFLKLPVAALLYLVWWAIRQNGDQTPVVDGDGDGGTPSDDGGAPADDGPGGHPHDGWDRLPRRSRRGPHDEPPSAAPLRIRPPELPQRERDPQSPHV